LLVAAAATAAVGLGLLIHGWISKTRIEQAEKFDNEVNAALALADAEPDQTNMSDGTLEDLYRARNEASRRLLLITSDAEREKAQAAFDEIERLIGIQEADSSKGLSPQQQNHLRERILSGDQSAIAELQAFAMGRAIDTEGSITRWRPFSESVSNDEYAAGIVEDLGRSAFADKGLTIHEQVGQVDAWKAIAEAINSGTLGGRGDGQSEVRRRQQDARGIADYSEVDENGKLILYDAFGNRKVLTNQEQKGSLGKLLRGEVDLSMGGGTTIINAPVIAPSPVTVTNGGSQVTQVAFSGGGGSAGGPSLTIYGLTGSIA
jgi:hypothetical protein